MNVDYNPYEGRQVTGATDTVLSRGRLVIEDGKFVGRAGAGSFLKRAARDLRKTLRSSKAEGKSESRNFELHFAFCLLPFAL